MFAQCPLCLLQRIWILGHRPSGWHRQNNMWFHAFFIFQPLLRLWNKNNGQLQLTSMGFLLVVTNENLTLVIFQFVAAQWVGFVITFYAYLLELWGSKIHGWKTKKLKISKVYHMIYLWAKQLSIDSEFVSTVQVLSGTAIVCNRAYLYRCENWKGMWL